jgi:hypothetical protein
MKFANAIKLHRKSGVRRGERGTRPIPFGMVTIRSSTDSPSALATEEGCSREEFSESGKRGNHRQLAAEKASQFNGIGVLPGIVTGLDPGVGTAIQVEEPTKSGSPLCREPAGYGYLFIIGYCRRLFLGGE